MQQMQKSVIGRTVCPLIAQDKVIGFKRFLRMLPSPKGIDDLRNACRKVSGSGILCGKNAKASGPLTGVLLGRVVDELVHDSCLLVKSSSLVSDWCWPAQGEIR